jgi:hypothetical protein
MSSFVRAVILVLGLSLGAMAGPAAAQQLTAAQLGAAEARLASFDALLDAGRMGDGVDFLPPPLLASLAARYGVTVDEARAATRDSVQGMLEDVTILESGHDFSRAQLKITPDGRRTYLLVPMAMTMQAGDIRAASASQTLMFEDQGQWWVLSVQPGVLTDLLREAYPEFAGVEFPVDVFEVLD